MKRSTWTRATLVVGGTIVMAFAGLACCKSESEPVQPDPEPVVAVTPAPPVPVPVPVLEEVEEGMSPAEQQALGTQLVEEVAGEINAANVEEAVAALEAELADVPNE